MTSNYIKTQDYQCWRVIEKGDGKVPADLQDKDWTAEHYTTMEKNFKARQLILNSLTRKDVDKVMSIPTTKEMWNAIIAMYTGSDDMVNNRKFEL